MLRLVVFFFFLFSFRYWHCFISFHFFSTFKQFTKQLVTFNNNKKGEKNRNNNKMFNRWPCWFIILSGAELHERTLCHRMLSMHFKLYFVFLYVYLEKYWKYTEREEEKKFENKYSSIVLFYIELFVCFNNKSSSSSVQWFALFIIRCNSICENHSNSFHFIYFNLNTYIGKSLLKWMNECK